MKIWPCIICTLLHLSQSGLCQSFVNLDFEQASFTGFGHANVPGWTEYYGYGDMNYSGGMTVIYNNEPLDLAGVSLVGRTNQYPAIAGRYSVLLYGGTSISQDGTNGAAIGQTGQIPLSAQSMTFWLNGRGNLQVSFNGQILPFTFISNGSDYAVYDVDVSPYAGETGDLLFTATWPVGGGSYDILDNIQFSTSPVPEPGTLSLYALGGVLFALRYWKISRARTSHLR